MSEFTVAFTADFCDTAGKLRFQDIGLDLLESHHIHHHFFPEHHKEIGPDQVGDAHGVLVLTPSVTARTLAGAKNLLVISRFGVGYDSVDVAACTQAGVLVTITVGAVDWSVAEATIGWMIALSHNMLIKDRLVRTGQWDERTKYMGSDLRHKTLGVVGLGGIARKTIELSRAFSMNQPLAFDPFISAEAAERAGVRLASLDDLMSQADFVSIHCPLTSKTRGLIGARELGLMKPTAYLINTARGGIVDEEALFQALKNRSIAGAALDCFESEPITSPHRFGQLENVILAPHSIAWTHEFFRDIGRTACQVMVDLSEGKRPNGVLNPEVFDHPRFQERWRKALT